MPQDDDSREKNYVPASPVKRALAWIGLIYMAILLGLSTYFWFTGRTFLGIAPLLAVPGLLGLAFVSVLSWKTTGNPRKATAIAIAVLLCLLALIILPDGIARLMANFRTA